MEWAVCILLATLFVAYVNGANDNFKGVATLLGSGTTDYRKALCWATITTLAGSGAAFFCATNLVKTFSGKGLVPDTLTASPEFLLAVAVGTSATVLLATLTGIPISTTHSLLGSLVGAGVMAVGKNMGFATLGKSFIVPLVMSPFIAIVLTAIVYVIFRGVRNVFGIERTMCVCIAGRIVPVPRLDCSNGEAIAMDRLQALGIVTGTEKSCQAVAMERYGGHIMGIQAHQLLDFLHFLSAGALSFARGLNDTPKIVALSVTAGMLGLRMNIGLVALAMAIGGLLSARKVATTMSYRITAMNHGQGFTANLMTALLVVFASRMGVPVSTTHVSCGSLFGIGLVNGKAHWKSIGGIFSAWIMTLPISAVLSALIYSALRAAGGR
ncbi:MAG: phosphate permease [Lentisphaerae bacterium RIFOXYB12_FULL_65_16]|nr:MAG: phosphate permease [Lentisphaerae bacterium RIFOXYA12_64_32]OGV87417.1 MAG: phosphate permease [Lentisphaerae bacterium RIFOXYB12_FULL_65_16]